MKALKLITYVSILFSLAAPVAQAKGIGDFLRLVDAIKDAQNGPSARGDQRAGFGDRFGRGGRRGGYFCNAVDRGWEEHAPHGSCHECLRQHGECIEKCYEEVFTCTVTGQNRNGSFENITETGTDRWQTEDRALSLCHRYGLDNCRSNGCNSKNDLVSRRSCRR